MILLTSVQQCIYMYMYKGWRAAAAAAEEEGDSGGGLFGCNYD
jgi:hypothetical protein